MSEQMNVIEQGVREKVRFETPQGLLTIEDLYSLPLMQPEKARQPVANLDEIAVGLDNQLQATSKSFVKAKSKDATLTELKLEIVKHIINTKLAEERAKEEAKKIADSNRNLAETYAVMIAEKKAEDIKNRIKDKSVEELEAEYAKLVGM